MGIKIKNLDEVVIGFRKPGAVSAATDVDVGRIPFAGFIKNIFAKLGTPGTGTTGSTIDLNLNGTSIFSGSTKLEVAATTGANTLGALDPDPPQVLPDDILTMDVDAISISPANLQVDVTVSKRDPAKANNVADLDSI